MRQLRLAILAAAAGALNNAALKQKHLLAYSSGELEAREGEVLIHVSALDVRWSVVVPRECDKRSTATSTTP
jgi:hypothetical protein